MTPTDRSAKVAEIKSSVEVSRVRNYDGTTKFYSLRVDEYDALLAILAELGQENAMLRAALAVIEAEAWQPIETAPRDGTDVLFLMRGTEIQMVAAFDSSVGDQMFPWITEDGPNRHIDAFSHWRPLPPPPKVAK